MSNLSTPKFELKASKYLFIILLFTHGGAIFCISAVSIYYQFKLILTILCVLSFVKTIRRHVFYYSTKAVKQFCQLDSCDYWKLWLFNGQEVDAMLSGSSFIHPYCTILNFRSAESNSPYTIIILPGSVDDISRRRLQATLAFL